MPNSIQAIQALSNVRNAAMENSLRGLHFLSFCCAAKRKKTEAKERKIAHERMVRGRPLKPPSGNNAHCMDLKSGHYPLFGILKPFCAINII
jgi:hypothetical protein